MSTSKEPRIWPSVLFLGLVIGLIALAVFSSGCTPNTRARSFGGTETVVLAPGEKVLNITWKTADMWLLVELPDGSKEFREYSAWGIMNGKIIIKETK